MRLGWILGVAALLAAPLRAQSMEEMSVARDFARAVGAGDTATLTQLADFERRAAERLARGLDPHHWSELDADARQLAIEFALDDWTGSARGFNRSAKLVSVESVPDPDAGLGPVPDRHILRLVLQRISTGEYRDLLLSLTPDLRVLDVQQGEPYAAGENPDGPAGLRPPRQLAAPAAGVRWPDNIEDALRQEALRDVETLASAPAEGVEAALETLHRLGRPAVAALLERLVELDAAAAPNVLTQSRLLYALGHITGRAAAVVPAPSGADAAVAAATGAAAADPPTATHAAVQDWLVWHADHGWSFVPVPLEGSAPVTDAAPAPAEAGPATAPPAAPDTAAPPPEAGKPPLDPATAPTPPAPPTPLFTMPPRSPEARAALFPAAAELKFRYAGRRVSGRDVDAQLAPELREALNDWAETAQRLELSVVSTGRPEVLVIGRASDQLLEQAAAAMDDAAQLLAPLVPVLPPRDTHTVVAFVFDEKGYRTPAWVGLLDDIVKRELAFAEDIEPLRKQARALTRRQAPFFIQPTWDLAGEGEFKLANEFAGKFAQCFVTSRAGELPPCVLWGFDALVELRLYKGVYNLNTTGFVFTADHFDWAVRTKQMLEHRLKGKDFSLAAQAADASAAGQAIEAQMITWAVLDYLSEHPADLARLLGELAAVQDAADPEHTQWTWRVPPVQTEGALARGLEGLDPKHLANWLDKQ
jgi:hypothetical protein